MLAAEAAFAAIRSGDTSATGWSSYQTAIDASVVRRELYRSETSTRCSTRPRRRSGVLGLVARHGRLVVPGSGADPAPATSGCASWTDTTARQAKRPIRRCHHVRSIADCTFDRADERALLRHTPPRGPAVASHRSRPRHLPDAMPRGVRQSLHAILSRERLRNGGRRTGRQASAHQPVELRPLQDVRHHGSVPDRRLGAARGRRRPTVRRHVTLSTSKALEGRRDLGDRRAGDRSARRHVRLARAGARARSTRWRDRAAADLRVLARPDSGRRRSTSATAASSSSRARISTASGSRASSGGSATARRADRRRAAARARWRSCAAICARAGLRRSRSTARAGRRAWRSPAPSGWRARPAADRAVSHRGVVVLDRQELGPPQVPKPGTDVAIAIGEPIDVPPEADDATIERHGRSSSGARTLERRARVHA